MLDTHWFSGLMLCSCRIHIASDDRRTTIRHPIRKLIFKDSSYHLSKPSSLIEYRNVVRRTSDAVWILHYATLCILCAMALTPPFWIRSFRHDSWQYCRRFLPLSISRSSDPRGSWRVCMYNTNNLVCANSFVSYIIFLEAYTT